MLETNNQRFNKKIEEFLKETFEEVKKKGKEEVLVYSKIIEKISSKEINKDFKNYCLDEYQNEFRLLFRGHSHIKKMNRGNFVKGEAFIYDKSASSDCNFKIYLSIKPEKKKEVIDRLVYIICRYQENHDNSLTQTKFRIESTNDEFVMRFGTEEQCIEFINFMKNEEKIMSSLDESNIFLPNTNGIMIINDKGGSYNRFIENMISEYIEANHEFNMEEFYNFVLSYNLEKLIDQNKSLEVLTKYREVFLAKMINVADEKIIKDILNLDLNKKQEKVIDEKFSTIEELLKVCYKDFTSSNNYSKDHLKSNIYERLTNSYDLPSRDHHELERYNIMYDIFQYIAEKYSNTTKNRFRIVLPNENNLSKNYSLSSNNAFLLIDDYRMCNTQMEYKIYLSIKPEKYLDVIDKVMKIVEKVNKDNNSVVCNPMFRTFPANDGISLRLLDEKILNEFLSYIEVDSEIKNSFDKKSLIVPNLDGVMILSNNNNNSYVSFVTEAIYNYLEYILKNKKEIDIEDFKEFIMNIDAEENKEIINKYQEILIGKINNQNDELLVKKLFYKQPELTKIKKKEEEQ